MRARNSFRDSTLLISFECHFYILKMVLHQCLRVDWVKWDGYAIKVMRIDNFKKVFWDSEGRKLNKASTGR